MIKSIRNLVNEVNDPSDEETKARHAIMLYMVKIGVTEAEYTAKLLGRHPQKNDTLIFGITYKEGMEKGRPSKLAVAGKVVTEYTGESLRRMVRLKENAELLDVNIDNIDALNSAALSIRQAIKDFSTILHDTPEELKHFAEEAKKYAMQAWDSLVSIVHAKGEYELDNDEVERFDNH